MSINQIYISNGEKQPKNVDEVPKNNMQTAIEFERIFAQHLVQEMTKGLFDSPEGQAFTGHSASLYREHITGTLAKELAEQQRLGMADLILKHWGESPATNIKSQEAEEL